MTVLLVNNVRGYLASALASTATALTLADSGDAFPLPGAGEYFYATITDPSGLFEIVKATARTGATLTIVRAQEDTVALNFLTGSLVELRVTAQSVLDAVADSAFDTAAYFAAAGTGTSVGLNVGTGKTLNATNGTVLLPAATTPAQTAEGAVVWDSNDDLLTVGTGAGRKTMVDTNSTQTLTNKTLTSPTITSPTITSPTIATIVNTGTLTLPTSTDTIVGRATGDTLTNKVISGADNTLTVRLNQSDVTGTLPVSKGGTGAASLTANTVLIGNGTSAVTGVAPGASGNVLVSDGTGWTSAARSVPVVTGNAGKVLRNDGSVSSWGNVVNFGTLTNTTSGTSVTITDIPSWVKRITVLFNQVVLSTTNNVLVRVGAGSVVTSGYTSSSTKVASATAASANATNGLIINAVNNAVSGSMVLHNVTGNVWIANFTLGTAASETYYGGGRISLTGALDRVSVVAGAGTLAGGSFNVLWE